MYTIKNWQTGNVQTAARLDLAAEIATNEVANITLRANERFVTIERGDENGYITLYKEKSGLRSSEGDRFPINQLGYEQLEQHLIEAWSEL